MFFLQNLQKVGVEQALGLARSLAEPPSVLELALESSAEETRSRKYAVKLPLDARIARL